MVTLFPGCTLHASRVVFCTNRDPEFRPITPTTQKLQTTGGTTKTTKRPSWFWWRLSSHFWQSSSSSLSGKSQCCSFQTEREVSPKSRGKLSRVKRGTDILHTCISSLRLAVSHSLEDTHMMIPENRFCRRNRCVCLRNVCRLQFAVASETTDTQESTRSEMMLCLRSGFISLDMMDKVTQRLY